MAGNSFGKLFKLTTFGESHGAAIGGIIDGCPPNLVVDFDFIQKEMNRRKPGQSNIVTQRMENDEVEFLSGIFEGKTTGAPIAFSVKNNNAQSSDYNNLKDVYRPSHADFTYQNKYGIRDHRGSGRASARETLSRVAAGAIAKLFLNQYGISFHAYVSQIGSIKLLKRYDEVNFDLIESNAVRCPEVNTAAEMEKLILDTKEKGDTLGGVITCIINKVPLGLGEPVFDKLHANLGKAMLSINAVKGFEYGSGFDGVELLGSEHNDQMIEKEGKIEFITNHSGGIQGGISNGAPIYFRVAFKPIASILQKQQTINKAGNKIDLEIKGRHDVCVVPRAVPIVEAMAALVIADFMLLHNSNS